MKIYFCDICNQSIPLQDLDSGTAVAVKGKLLCAACNATVAASGKASAPAATAPGSGGGGRAAMAVGALALVGAVAIGIAVDQRSKSRNSEAWVEIVRVEKALRESIDGSQRGTTDVRGEVEALAKKVETLNGELRGEREQDAGRLKHDLADVTARLEKIRGYVEENEKLKDTLQQMEIRIAAGADTAASLRRDLESLRATVAEAPARPAAAAPSSSPPALAGPTDGAPPADAASALPVELQKHVKSLQSSDPGKRWDAVGELGRSSDPRVIAFLIPMLRDKDDFVRYHAAEMLGDLDAKSAMLALVDALGDEQQFVRDVVYAQLRKISRKTLKFDPAGKKEERDKQQRAWRSWVEQAEKGAPNG